MLSNANWLFSDIFFFKFYSQTQIICRGPYSETMKSNSGFLFSIKIKGFIKLYRVSRHENLFNNYLWEKFLLIQFVIHLSKNENFCSIPNPFHSHSHSRKNASQFWADVHFYYFFLDRPYLELIIKVNLQGKVHILTFRNTRVLFFNLIFKLNKEREKTCTLI